MEYKISPAHITFTPNGIVAKRIKKAMIFFKISAYRK